MQRAISRLSQRFYDVAVIGGGIYGACVARDAALRGLSVALVDQGDFGSATSANSQKIIHGGLRYLQHADFRRMRESIQERSILMRIAPHLVFPMPFLIPVYEQGVCRKVILSIALKLNDLIGYDRNYRMSPDKVIPNGQVISKDRCLRLCSGLEPTGLVGGALFYDGQITDTERLTLSTLVSASRAGADLANYARVTGFLLHGNKIRGFRAEDLLAKDPLEVHAQVVVNCGGPWNDQILDLLKLLGRRKKKTRFKAFVLATRQLIEKIAVGVPCKEAYRDEDAVLDKGFRYFFITPWRNASLIGTYYSHFSNGPDDFAISELDIVEFLRQVNAALPSANLQRTDVRYVLGGLLPSDNENGETGHIRYTRHYEIHDHAVEDGIRGLVSVTGVKYTTARDVAQKAVDLVERKLGRRPKPTQTDKLPLPGGHIANFESYLEQELARKTPVASDTSVAQLIRTYGTEYRGILRYAHEKPGWGKSVGNGSPVLRAQVVHAVRNEMAQKLSDVIFRRTELAATGDAKDACLETCAEMMSSELEWPHTRRFKEIEEVKDFLLKQNCAIQ